MSTPIWHLSAVETAAAIRTKTLSCEEVISAHVDRMRATHERLNAVVVDLGDDALKQARETDAAIARGEKMDVLAGVPITVKINIDLEGQANSNGVPALKNNLAHEDAPAIANLKNAGAIPIGMTNTPEFSLRICTNNPLHGQTFNPWDKTLTCGGSSGGAASSIAAGVGVIAHGNDIGGSLRWPAHCNGVATIRPTGGRIPAHNSSAGEERSFAAQLFSTNGPLARNVADVRLGLEVMSRASNRDPLWVPAPMRGPAIDGPIRVGVVKVPDDMEPDPALLAFVAKAADHLSNEGYVIEEVEIPDTGLIWDKWADLLITEIRTLLAPALDQFGSAEFQSVYDVFKAMSKDLSKEEYMLGLAQRLGHLREWMAILENTPILLTPVLVHDPVGIRGDLDGEQALVRIMRQGMRFIGIGNYLGLPSSVVPVGLHNGHPVGVQITANRFREDLSLDAAAAIEKHAGLLGPQLWDRMA